MKIKKMFYIAAVSPESGSRMFVFVELPDWERGIDAQISLTDDVTFAEYEEDEREVEQLLRRCRESENVRSRTLAVCSMTATYPDED